MPIGCLSNTDLLHWEHQSSQWPILAAFDYQFVSFDLGLVKPDLAVFQAVSDRLPVSRDRVLFLDDNALNTEAARTFGFLSEQVRGVVETRQALVKTGVLTT